ncbi:MAG TPA: hypothetical protein VMV19_05960 [Xanthobacteraceae bacterium]|nr:hypothetical protein [Xanthobacteraceae bacterium]
MSANLAMSDQLSRVCARWDWPTSGLEALSISPNKAGLSFLLRARRTTEQE